MKQSIVCVAGFGDNGSMYEPLLATTFANDYTITPYNLPGFGAPPLAQEATLEGLVESLDLFCTAKRSSIVIAHSVASIIATLAAHKPDSSIETVISLEGNLTPEDAYFSGTASDYDDPDSFRTAFLCRLDQMIETQPIIERYRNEVVKADPQSLWELGHDAFRYSQHHVPGDELAKVKNAIYLYNPDNLPAASLKWLSTSKLPQIQLQNASHWPSVDQPDLLASKLYEVISRIA